MRLDEIQHIGVLGAGLMGHGIAQVFASAGYPVNIFDVDAAALRAAKDRIAGNFKVFIELNLAQPDDVDRCLDRIRLCPSIEALCQGPQFIIEAILEDLKLKQPMPNSSVWPHLRPFFRATPPPSASPRSVQPLNERGASWGLISGTRPMCFPAWR
jgi:hypothetical protein